MAVRREAFEQVSGFDATLEACEDVDFCGRLRAAGWRVVSDERLESIHHGDPPTLWSLFRSELWRGRDNLRVSLRSFSLRGLPSILIPILDLLAIAAVVAGLLAAPAGGISLVVGGVVVVGAMAALRAARMLGTPGPRTLTSVAQAAAVALTYEAARALALVFRSRHRRARQASQS
jgi:hypothetical protein